MAIIRSVEMSVSVTLQLPEKVVRQARDKAERTGRELEAVLSEWIERGSRVNVTSVSSDAEELVVYTPFFENDALVAQKMLEGLERAKAEYERKREAKE
jgi:hypothetical protein